MTIIYLDAATERAATMPEPIRNSIENLAGDVTAWIGTDLSAFDRKQLLTRVGQKLIAEICNLEVE